MSEHTIALRWERGEQVFVDNRYNRHHTIDYDGGFSVPFSSSPSLVRVPLSDPAAVDPEEALVSAVASCHMLWFLALAAKAGYRVDSYPASGSMAKNEHGKLFVARVTLRPQVRFSGDKLPDQATFDALHHAAHEECNIAHSVRSEIVFEGQMLLP